MNNPMDLTGKHIVVTGASSGIGRATCIYLSNLGANVSLIARREDKLNETVSLMNEGKHKIYSYDLSSKERIEGIEDLVKQIVDDNDKIDGFVHASGISTIKPLSMTKYDFMLEMTNINLFSFIEFVRILSKKKYSNDGASIVAISTEATRRADKGKTAYISAKGSLDSVVKVVAVELGESRGIRANTINPGWVKTDMYYEYIRLFGQEKMDEMTKNNVLGISEPENVASVIAFLLSEASKMITGQNIFVDSGVSIHQ